MDLQDQKAAAAAAAIDFIKDDCILGIGTGSTAEAFIAKLSQARVRPAKIVSSSERSTALLEKAGMPVSDLNSAGPLDIYVDGADECTKRFTLIKGGGGAHTFEKILAAAARKFVVICDSSKLVEVHASFPVAVEVLPAARSLVARKLAGLGGRPVWREDFTTDAGNQIIDVHSLDLTDAAAREAEVCMLAGVVDCGICARRLADTILIADQDGSIIRLDR